MEGGKVCIDIIARSGDIARAGGNVGTPVTVALVAVTPETTGVALTKWRPVATSPHAIRGHQSPQEQTE